MAARIKLGELLVRAGVLDDFKLKAALAEQQRWGGRLGKILVEMNFVSEELLTRALSKQLGVPRAKLENAWVPPDVLAKIDNTFAVNNVLCPERFDAAKKTLYVAMADPTNVGAVDELRFKTGLRVETTLGGELEVTQAIDRVFFGRGPIDGIELGRDRVRGAEPLDLARSAMGGYEEYGFLPGPPPPASGGPAPPPASGGPAPPPASGGPAPALAAPGLPAASGPAPLPPTLAQLLAPAAAAPPRPIALAVAPNVAPAVAPNVAPSPSPSGAGRPALDTALEMAMALDGAQKKQLKAIRVMLELLIEKGVFSRDEYVALVNKR